MARFVHYSSIYDSDAAFLDMALPFVTEGLERREPVLVSTTPANLALIDEVLGDRAGEVDYAETAYFGRRTAQRVAAFDRYWRDARSRGDAPTEVRILAEPIWAGRSAADRTAWKRMEAGLNVVFVDLPIRMVCPYDARDVPPDVLASARHTHPADVVGRDVHVSSGFQDPVEYAWASDAAPLPAAPGAVATVDYGSELHRLRDFVLAFATQHGISPSRADFAALAAGEVASYLAGRGGRSGNARAWANGSGIVFEVVVAGAGLDDPYAAFWPPSARRAETAGMWVANQICSQLDMRQTGDGWSVRLRLPGVNSVEHRLPDAIAAAIESL
jgi:MEDS: MEthanogen/methylotroph, DcmR Sensory domain